MSTFDENINFYALKDTLKEMQRMHKSGYLLTFCRFHGIAIEDVESLYASAVKFGNRKSAFLEAVKREKKYTRTLQQLINVFS
ncbi:hypothetical protein [Bacillus sp. S14(2024)]|uniref:hypothetical protein n=1 Tax=Bacillus sp. S14(2024) TaxID=3162884 RepID=UPI003D1EF34C